MDTELDLAVAGEEAPEEAAEVAAEAEGEEAPEGGDEAPEGEGARASKVRGPRGEAPAEGDGES